MRSLLMGGILAWKHPGAGFPLHGHAGRRGHSSAESLILFTVVLLAIVLVLYLDLPTFEAVVKAIAMDVQRRWFPE